MPNHPYHDIDPLKLLNDLFSEEWENRMQADPWLASLYGDHRFDDRLPDVSSTEIEHQTRQNQAFLDRVNAIDRSSLDAEGRLNYDIFARDLQNRIMEYGYNVHLMPVSRLSGFHINFPDLPDYLTFKTGDDYQNYIQRLSQFERYVQQNIELMRLGIKNGYMPPQVTLEGIDRSIRNLIDSSPESNPFFQPFTHLPGQNNKEFDILRKEASAAIAGPVARGYLAFLNFLNSEYLPAARNDTSASGLPDGRSYYRYCIRKFTTLELTPEEVHSIGLGEVKRIREEMAETVRETGFTEGFQDFLAFLRSDPRFYVTSPEALMKEAALIMKRVDNRLPRLFNFLPRTPCGLKEIPAFTAPEQTTAYYMVPSGDGTTPGYYYVNTYNLKSRPLYEFEALTLHEAIPGHHLQLALQMELSDVPQFRRFNEVTAFVEGWALYAERLGLEIGFYTDPYNNFGRLTYEMWRAARLVVDTGIHELGWTRQQAIDFMAENTALSMHNIANEVDRYIAWPGQALAYKTGELKIRELRLKAEKNLGASFDLREFHAVVLQHGAIPLNSLESLVTTWIRNKAVKY